MILVPTFFNVGGRVPRVVAPMAVATAVVSSPSPVAILKTISVFFFLVFFS